MTEIIRPAVDMSTEVDLSEETDKMLLGCVGHTWKISRYQLAELTGIVTQIPYPGLVYLQLEGHEEWGEDGILWIHGLYGIEDLTTGEQLMVLDPAVPLSIKAKAAVQAAAQAEQQ